MDTGKYSQCIEFTDFKNNYTAGCFEVECNRYNTKYMVIFDQKQGLVAYCSKNDIGKAKYLNGQTVKCVDPQLMCQRRHTECPYDCLSRGRCQENRKCACNYFFTGPYCQFEKKAPKGLKNLWNKLKRYNGVI